MTTFKSEYLLPIKDAIHTLNRYFLPQRYVRLNIWIFNDFTPFENETFFTLAKKPKIEAQKVISLPI